MEMQLIKEYTDNIVREYKQCVSELVKVVAEAETRIDTQARKYCQNTENNMQAYVTDVQKSLRDAEEKNDARHLLTLNMCRLGAAATLVASGNFTAVQAVDQLSEIEWAMKTKFK